MSTGPYENDFTEEEIDEGHFRCYTCGRRDHIYGLGRYGCYGCKFLCYECYKYQFCYRCKNEIPCSCDRCFICNEVVCDYCIRNNTCKYCLLKNGKSFLKGTLKNEHLKKEYLRMLRGLYKGSICKLFEDGY